MADDKPIPLKCCQCGALVGFFDWSRLSRVVRASLRALADTFGSDAGDDDAAPFPIVCTQCQR